MIDYITNEILLASQILHTNNINRIAEELGYRPMLIITALYKGEADGKLTWSKKQETFTIAEDVEFDSLAVTEGMNEMAELIEQFMGFVNADKKDMVVDELPGLLGGLPKLHVEIAIKSSHKFDTYELFDPKDKESSYTFVSLKGNGKHLWGQKRFKSTKKRAQDAVKRAKK